jgi:hypothetical protein
MAAGRAGDQVGGQRAAKRIPDRDALARQGPYAGQDARPGLIDWEQAHHSAL